MKYYIGIDLGGTNIAAGLVNEEFEIVASVSCPTALPRPAAEVEADMAALCRKLVEEKGLTMADIGWVGIGTPGSVDPTTGYYVILLTNRVHPTRDNLLQAQFRRRFHNAMYAQFCRG